MRCDRFDLLQPEFAGRVRLIAVHQVLSHVSVFEFQADNRGNLFATTTSQRQEIVVLEYEVVSPKPQVKHSIREFAGQLLERLL